MISISQLKALKACLNAPANREVNIITLGKALC
jgi:hypothetical protein